MTGENAVETDGGATNGASAADGGAHSGSAAGDGTVGNEPTSGDEMPRGAIPRVERQRSHRRFLWAVRPPAAMTDLVHARRMLMHGETASMFFPPETDVLLTSTIPDDELMRLSFADEVRTVVAFEPDRHLPFDFPVYGDMDAERRVDHVRQVAAGTLDMAALLDGSESGVPERDAAAEGPPSGVGDRDAADGETGAVEGDAGDGNATPGSNLSARVLREARECSTRLLPLMKGTTSGERGICERVAEEIEAPVAAKYGTQYMTVPGSGNYPALRRVLESIDEETGGMPMLVVGLLSPEGKYSLEGVPDNVVAAAGQNQWRERVSPRSSSPAEMRAAYAALDREVAAALGVESSYDPDRAASTADEAPAEFEATAETAVTDADGTFEAGFSGAAVELSVRDERGRRARALPASNSIPDPAADGSSADASEE